MTNKLEQEVDLVADSVGVDSVVVTGKRGGDCRTWWACFRQ